MVCDPRSRRTEKQHQKPRHGGIYKKSRFVSREIVCADPAAARFLVILTQIPTYQALTCFYVH